MSDEIISLGNMLKELREKAGLTKLKTGEMVECDGSYLSRIELEGRIPSLKLFKVLIKVYKVEEKEKLALYKSYFTSKLSDDMLEVQETIKMLIEETITEKELDHFVKDNRTSLDTVELLKEPLVEKMLTLLKSVPPEKRMALLQMFCGLGQLETTKFVMLDQIIRNLMLRGLENLIKTNDVIKII